MYTDRAGRLLIDLSSREQLQEMMDEQEPVPVTCFVAREESVDPEQFYKLLVSH